MDWRVCGWVPVAQYTKMSTFREAVHVFLCCCSAFVMQMHKERNDAHGWSTKGFAEVKKRTNVIGWHLEKSKVDHAKNEQQMAHLPPLSRFFSLVQRMKSIIMLDFVLLSAQKIVLLNDPRSDKSTSSHLMVFSVTRHKILSYQLINFFLSSPKLKSASGMSHEKQRVDKPNMKGREEK